MKQHLHPAWLGLFVVGGVLLAIVLLMLHSSGGFSRQDRLRYTMVFDSSVKGLNVGAPVTLKGVKIGEVSEIQSRFFPQKRQVMNLVNINIYPDSIGLQDSSKPVTEELITHGLSGQLKNQSVLTGLLFIEMDFHKNRAHVAKVDTDYSQIPVLPSDFEQIYNSLEKMNIQLLSQNISAVMENLRILTDQKSFQNLALHIDETLMQVKLASQDIRQRFHVISDEVIPAVQDMRQLSRQMNTDLPVMTRQFSDASLSMKNAMSVVEDSLSPSSPLLFNLQQTSQSVGRAAQAVENLAKMLEQQPQAIWSGPSSDRR